MHTVLVTCTYLNFANINFTSILCCCVYTDDEVVSVNGRSLEVPNTTNAEVKLCVSFGTTTSTDGTVVLAHRQGDPKTLLAYNLNTTNCTTAPPAGEYIVGVFTQTRSNVLREPATTPTFSFSMIPNSEYYVTIYNLDSHNWTLMHSLTQLCCLAR